MLSYDSSEYSIRGHFVIFSYDSSKIELEVRKVAQSCQDYDLLDLELIDKPSFILHKKYIQELKINCALDKNLDFTPKERLDLHLGRYMDNDFDRVIEYLNCQKLDHLNSEVTLQG